MKQLKILLSLSVIFFSFVNAIPLYKILSDTSSTLYFTITMFLMGKNVQCYAKYPSHMIVSEIDILFV